MQIDRSNYEIWLIDWLDGNLNKSQEEMVTHFLNENPDLRNEFSELSAYNISPSQNSFPDKKSLFKSTADIPESQFEYLCAAYLENDLSKEQLTELNQIIDQDSDRRKTFDLILKTKIYPVIIPFKNKTKLLKKTFAQRIIQLSAIGLSSAAAIVLIIITYISVPRNPSDIIENSAQGIVVDSLFKSSSSGIKTESIIAENKTGSQVRNNTRHLISGEQSRYLSDNDGPTEADQSDTLVRNYPFQEIPISKIPLHSVIKITGSNQGMTLVSSDIIMLSPDVEDERSRINKFMAKTFRTRVLGENTSADSPIKGYELAEAGVTGLNKLLGWDMALEKTNNVKGELQSVQFSSKLLTFNAPVKKTEPLP